jgi:hypothetical protein
LGPGFLRNEGLLSVSRFLLSFYRVRPPRSGYIASSHFPSGYPWPRPGRSDVPDPDYVSIRSLAGLLSVIHSYYLHIDSLPRSGLIWLIFSSRLPSARLWDFPDVPAPDYVIVRYSVSRPVPSQLPTVPFTIGISPMLIPLFLRPLRVALVCPAQVPVTPVTRDRLGAGSDTGTSVSYVIMLLYPFRFILLFIRFHMLTYSVSGLYFVSSVLLFPFRDVALTLLD